MEQDNTVVGARLLAAWLRTTGELQAFLDHYVVHGPAVITTLTRHLDRLEHLEARAHEQWQAYRTHLAEG